MIINKVAKDIIREDKILNKLVKTDENLTHKLRMMNERKVNNQIVPKILEMRKNLGLTKKKETAKEKLIKAIKKEANKYNNYNNFESLERMASKYKIMNTEIYKALPKY